MWKTTDKRIMKQVIMRHRNGESIKDLTNLTLKAINQYNITYSAKPQLRTFQRVQENIVEFFLENVGEHSLNFNMRNWNSVILADGNRLQAKELATKLAEDILDELDELNTAGSLTTTTTMQKLAQDLCTRFYVASSGHTIHIATSVSAFSHLLLSKENKKRFNPSQHIFTTGPNLIYKQTIELAKTLKRRGAFTARLLVSEILIYTSIKSPAF